MYDLTTNPFDTLAGAGLLTLRGGKISGAQLTFATFPVGGEAATSQSPSGTAPRE
jgi:hypothetical protein